MPEMTLSEAAKWAGKGRPAILKAIQKGVLSARKDDNQQWRIDPAELERVYRPGNSQGVSRSPSETPEATTGNDREMALLKEIADTAKREAVEARRERDDWKAEAAKWQEEAAAVRLLVAPAAAPRGLLSRFWRK